MRNSEKLKGLIILVSALLFMSIPAWAEDAVSKQGKKYPHPHTLHMEVMEQGPADFSSDEIGDWPDFVRSLQKKTSTLPFSQEGRMAINDLKPDSLSSDDKAMLVSELNRLLRDKTVAGIKGKTQNTEDLKWVNRNVIAALFPHISRKEKGKGLKKITCASCHEAYAQTEKNAEKNKVDEKMVLDCFSNVISGKTEGKESMEDCLKMADTLKKSRIQPYGPLRNVIQKNVLEGDIPFLVALHPEEPYTYKPLLKRLVCIECHGQERKIDKIKARDGKTKKIPVFYGYGFREKAKEKTDEDNR